MILIYLEFIRMVVNIFKSRISIHKGSRVRLSRKVFLSFVIAQVPMAVTLTVNLFVDIVPLFDISYVLSALAMYGIILSDKIEQERHLQKEIIRQQQEITHERLSDSTIPFSAELEHTRAYLAVEQAQYDDILL